MGDSYISVKLSDEIPKSITCKDILSMISQYESLPERIDIQGYSLALKHLPLTRPIYKLYESNNPNEEFKNCKIEELSNSFMGTLYVDLLAPTKHP